jgi:hypothetical protein
MNICIVRPAAFMVATLLGQAVKPLPSIEVTGRDVTVVQGVNDTLGTLSEKVTTLD